ncbi:MAG: DUF6599 family protein [Terriglobia bacterium]|jgi:hypothetical protein
MRTIALYLLLILASPALLLAQEKAGQDTAPAVIPAAAKAKLVQLLPDPSEVGAARTGEQKFYSSDLYQYTDGGADVYLEYGLVAMVHQEYKSSSTDFTLDIYNMGTPANAFGIYAAESSPDYHFLPIGAEGYGANEILNFLQDEFYAKLSAFSDKEKTGPLLERFAREVSRRIGPSAPMPQFLSLFPPQHLVSHSLKYVKKSPLGHEFLAPAILASYAWGEKQTSLLISRAPDPHGAAKKVGQLRDYFARSGKVVPRQNLAPGAFSGSNQYEGEAVFFASGSYAVLCLNPPPDGESFLKSVIERIAERGAGVTF